MATTLTISNLITSSDCYKYADSVLRGEIGASRRVKQAGQRFFDDLEKSEDPAYPWKFDIQKAYRPIDFIEEFTVPTKGDYDKMRMLPWQHFVEGNVYGWVDKKTGLRRFREALILVGSGNGKSTLITGNAIYGVSKDGERGAEIYTLANSKDQARIISNECKAQIQASPRLTPPSNPTKHFRPTRDAIYFDKTNSVIRPLATDSKTLQGLNVHMAVFDELQDYRDYKLINAIKAKGKKRRQPLFFYISTLGDVIDGPLMDYYILGGNILDGADAVSQRVADRFFVYIAEIDEEDDPNNHECWIKANPSLGALLSLDDLIDEWERVKLIPSERSDFINKQLNVFTSVDELSLLDPKTIKLNNREIVLSDLEGKRCYGGFDLSDTEDFTSACLEFPLDDNWFALLSHTWVPAKKRKADNEKLDWENLEREGLITVVRGEYVDHQLVFDWFEEQKAKYRIDCIGYDPAKALILVQLLTAQGYVLETVRQGEFTLTGPLDHLKERFLDGKIIHNNNRLYNWYLGNVKLTKRSANATYLPTKQNRYRKIDGFAAHLNSHVAYLRRNPVYIPPDKQLATVIEI